MPYTAFLIGQTNRHLYSTTTHMFAESLALPARPGGYDALCQRLMAGELSATVRFVEAAETFWIGVEKWSQERGIKMEQELDDLIQDQE